MEDSKEKLQKLGLEDKLISEIYKNKKIVSTILELAQLGEAQTCEKKVGILLYQLAAKITENISQHKSLLAKCIIQNKINSQQKIDFALAYLKGLKSDADFKQKEFEVQCGIGIEVTEKDVKNCIDAFMTEKLAEIKQQRYAINQSEYMHLIRDKLKFGDGKIIAEYFKQKLTEILGPETEEDKKLKYQAQQNQKQKQNEQEKKKDEKQENAPKVKLSELVARDLKASVNSQKHKDWHAKNFGGKIYTRFPPEPNGYLHIGHCKAMRFSFTIAEDYKGHCYLRFDDTNPEKENMEYINSIFDNVSWLGYTIYKQTSASQNFQQLYEWAVQLIKLGKAYVCDQTKLEMKAFKEKLLPSPYRNRSIEENLKLFEGMRMGLYEEGEKCLRARIDYANENPNLRDPVIYRIRYVPHPKTGDKWCIYPMYDYAHPLCDSIEGVTHSLCTLEFENRRELYYWPLEQLDLYRPYVWEYSRLNISNTVLSKRKLLRLVKENFVNGWDDPRLLTIVGMKRRGYTQNGINDFCDEISVTRRSNEMLIQFHLLEHCIRSDLDRVAPRTLAVIDPIPLHLTNIKQSKIIEAPDFPKEGVAKGAHKITLSSELYVDKEDVRLEDHKEFFGFAPNKIVGLKYAGVVQVTKVVGNDKGEPVEIFAEYLGETTKEKPKTFVHWIANEDSMNAEVRLYDVLFTEYDPAKAEDYITILNPKSKIVMANSKVNKYLIKSKKLDKFQFERLGYFVVDYDTVEGKTLVFNKTVGLIEKDKVKAHSKINEKGDEKEEKEQKQENHKEDKKKKKE